MWFCIKIPSLHTFGLKKKKKKKKEGVFRPSLFGIFRPSLFQAQAGQSLPRCRPVPFPKVWEPSTMQRTQTHGHHHHFNTKADKEFRFQTLPPQNQAISTSSNIVWNPQEAGRSLQHTFAAVRVEEGHFTGLELWKSSEAAGMCVEAKPSDFHTNPSNQAALNYFCGNKILSIYEFQMGRDSCRAYDIIPLDTGGWKGKTGSHMWSMSTVITELGKRMCGCWAKLVA